MTLKEKMGLTGAILSIVMGAWMSIGGIIVMTMLNEIKDYLIYYQQSTTAYYVYLVTTILLLLFSIAIIVVASIFCAKRKSKSLGITLLSLISVLALLEIVGSVTAGFNASIIVAIIIMLTAIGFLITYLSLKFPAVPATIDIETPIAQTKTIVPAPQLNTAKNSQTDINKIELLKSLKEQGHLTEEEFKTQLLKELDK